MPSSTSATTIAANVVPKPYTDHPIVQNAAPISSDARYPTRSATYPDGNSNTTIVAEKIDCSTMIAVNDIPIWSFQKSVMTGIGKSAKRRAACATSSEGVGGAVGQGPRVA